MTRVAVAVGFAGIIISGTSAETTASLQTTAPVKLVSPAAGSASHKILTANILLASSAHDGKPAAWANRRSLCIDVIKRQNADIICMQEVLRGQFRDMVSAFPGYEAFGFAGPEMDSIPDDDYHGVTKNVILYRKDRYELISANCYWLSETPLIAGSVSWDALRGRHANWVRLKDKKTGHQFRVIDTHFDHKAKLGRVEQAKIINRESAQYADDFTQILCGDFNADINNPAIVELTSGGWTDTYFAVHNVKDPGRTYHALKGPAYETKAKNGKIDFIFVCGAAKPTAAAVIKDHDNDKYPSDHYFVSAELTF